MPTIYKTTYLPNFGTDKKQFYIGSNFTDKQNYLGSSTDAFYKTESKNNPQLFKIEILEYINPGIDLVSFQKIEEKHLKENNVASSHLFFNKVDFVPNNSSEMRSKTAKKSAAIQIENKIGIFADNSHEKYKEDHIKGGKNVQKIRKEKGEPAFPFTTENRSEWGKKSAETHKKNKTNFFSSEWQKEMNSRGASKGGSIGGKMLFVNKNSKNKRIHPDELDFYLESGWTRGCLMDRKNVPKKVWIKKDNHQTTINITELDFYLESGWIRGRL